MFRRIIFLILFATLVFAPLNAKAENIVKKASAEKCEDAGGVVLGTQLTNKKLNGTEVECVIGDPASGGPIVAYLKEILKYITGLVGVAITIALAYGGVRYITAGGSSDSLKQAKGVITNAIVGLILYIMMFGILNWLIPGGIFK